MNNYGKELILDIHEVQRIHLFNRKDLSDFMVQLCELLDMQREDLHFWDEEGIPVEEQNTEEHLIGTSAVQFITTSNITIHTLDVMKRVYLNIFSCKDYNSKEAARFCVNYFDGKLINKQTINRV